jgi:nicotinamide mononucleotide transporter
MILIDWITYNYIEIIAATLGLVSIYLQIKQNIWYWPVSIVLVSLYIIVYISAKLYADMSLQVYYLVVCIYGWHYWLFGNRESKSKQLPVSFISFRLAFKLSLIAVGLFFFIAFILIRFTDSDVPYWDAFTTALSFIATWMLARKIIENWLIWIVVDSVSVGIYFYKQLYPTTILFAVLTILAIVGYYAWKKDAKKQNQE